MSLISIEEACRRIKARVRPLLLEEEVLLKNGLGRVLAKPITARCSHPGCDLSAMDGFAVRAEDVKKPVSLRLIGESQAGTPFGSSVGAGEAVRISTGAPLPSGADTVVIQEHTRCQGDTVEIHKSATLGKHVRPTGLDFFAGDRFFAAGVRLGPEHLSLAASMNLATLPTKPPICVALLACGDELVLPGTPLQGHQIVSANSFGLRALFEKAGAKVTDLGIAKDDMHSLCEHIDTNSGTLLLTSGGASVGSHDFMQDALLNSGYTIDFWRIAMRPGKPLMFGYKKDQFVLGLPGNPVSALVCARVFGLFILEILLEIPHPNTTQTAILNCPLPANDERQDYLRAVRDDENKVTPLKKQDSFMMSTFAHANCLLMRPPHAPPASKGERVSILPL